MVTKEKKEKYKKEEKSGHESVSSTLLSIPPLTRHLLHGLHTILSHYLGPLFTNRLLGRSGH
jgi:hypothetical protein